MYFFLSIFSWLFFYIGDRKSHISSLLNISYTVVHTQPIVDTVCTKSKEHGKKCLVACKTNKHTKTKNLHPTFTK